MSVAASSRRVRSLGTIVAATTISATPFVAATSTPSNAPCQDTMLLGGHAVLIIAAQPTRGLDIGATAFVWQSLREASARGCGVLLISSDLDELFDICDRVVVMLSGRVAGTFEPPYSIGAVGGAMTGVGR